MFVKREAPVTFAYSFILQSRSCISHATLLRPVSSRFHVQPMFRSLSSLTEKLVKQIKDCIDIGFDVRQVINQLGLLGLFIFK
jgi:hypothetical protein